ncbi:MAG: 4-hydroxythreonine-4-phosphate dehydrogenase PdxA [candidate division WOR-3 bacterium]
MKRILVSIGDIGGINSYLIYVAAKKYQNIDFEISVSEKIFYDVLKNFKIEKKLKNIFFDFLQSKNIKLELGKPTKESTLLSIKSLDFSIEKMIKKKDNYYGLLTMPINKEQIAKFKIGFSGHTEYLEEKFRKKLSMLLYSKKISVLPLTRHIKLEKVENELFQSNIRKQIKNVQEFYRNFLKKEPKILLLCVNPHCSDGKLLGLSDYRLKRIICSLKKDFKIDGPVSADSAFNKNNIQEYDLFVGTYHDQVLIPFKMLSFNSGVNITLGLDFLRVSPDHGPAYDLCDRIECVDSRSTEESVKILLKFKSFQK